MTSLSRMGVNVQSDDDKVIQLNFDHIRIDVKHGLGHTEILKIHGAEKGRTDALSAIAKAADLSNQPLKFSAAQLTEHEQRALRLENGTWRLPQGRTTHIISDPGTEADPRMFRKSAFNEDLGRILNMVGHAVVDGDLIVVHTDKSRRLPREFIKGLDQFRDLAESEGRTVLEIYVGQDSGYDRADVNVMNIRHAAPIIIDHPGLRHNFELGKRTWSLDGDGHMNETLEDSVRGALNARSRMIRETDIADAPSING